MSLAPGDRLGAYEIRQLVGTGGMGDVYKARDKRLDRVVAIKVLPDRFATDTRRRERFEREARAVAALNHPHICNLHDIAEGARPTTAASRKRVQFLVMEYIEGQTLADRLVSGPLSIPEVLRCAIELADALDHAHRLGLVHRDLKPGNVMLTSTGTKLLDFGLAKLQATPDLPALSTVQSNDAPLTAYGALLGTYPYMAPEQLAGHEADARSDLFALGAIVYELATGRRAFRGPTVATLVGAILHTDPHPISDLQPLAPAALERVVARCLAKDPADRWQSARDLKFELQSIRDELATHERPRPVQITWARPRTLFLLAAAVLLAALTVGVLTWINRDRSGGSERAVRFAFVLPDGLTLTDLAIGGPVTISPDGQRLSFVAGGPDGIRRLYVRPLDSLTAQVLPGTDGAAFPFWSPDSQFVGFFAQRKLKKVPAAGGPAQTLSDAVRPRGGTWSTSGVIVFSAGVGHELYRIPGGGGVATRIGADGTNEERDWPFFLPDGVHFVYFGRPQKPGIYAASVDAPAATLVLKDYVSVAYVPNYLLVLIGPARGALSGTLLAQPFDPVGLQTTGEPRAIADHLAYRSSAARGAFSASNTGTLVFATADDVPTRLTWFDRRGNEIGSIGGAASYEMPVLSGDERTVAAERVDPQTQAEDIWLIDTVRDLPTRLTSFPSLDIMPVWSPDGSRVVFASARETPPNLYIKGVNGATDEIHLFRSIFNNQATDWTRDGQFIVYSSLDPKTEWDIWLLPMKSGMPANVPPIPLLRSEFNELLGQVSPDGRWLAYVSDESGTNDVYVRRFPSGGGKRRVSVNGGTAPRWRRDGRELFFFTLNGTLAAVTLKGEMDLEIGAPSELFKPNISKKVAAEHDVTNYAVGADGERFLISRARENARTSLTTVVLNWSAGLPPPR